jgi:hypothetical protein
LALHHIPEVEAERKRHPRALIAYVKLKNHWVYHRTAELICMQREGSTVSQEMTDALIDCADECVRLARDPRVGVLWYQLYETAAFAMLRFGNEASQERGRKLIRQLFAGSLPNKDLPAPSVEWLRERFDEYCPKDENDNPTDPWGLNVVRP